MKKLATAIVICCLCLSAAAQGTSDVWGYPVYDSVLEWTARNIYLPPLDLNRLPVLAKKPGGWYVYQLNYNGEFKPGTNFTLCWSSTTKQYMPAPQQAAVDYGSNLYVLGLIPPSKEYNLLPYYGYTGYNTDVINALKDSADLCDDNLQALARAYSNEALMRIGNQREYADSALMFRLPEKAGSMSPAQLDTFRKYEHLAIRTYKHLWKKNPNYETPIGDIWLKFSHEITSSFLTLAYYQGPAEALKEIEGHYIYDPFTIAFAKNLLNSCDKDAILFCYGDNDTYPLYYVQAHLKYRTDVLVVNLSLLALPRYVNMLRNGFFDALPLPMDFKPADYAGHNLEYVYDTDVRYNKLVTVKGLTPDAPRGTILKNEIMLLDIIRANRWRRPLCFASTSSNDAFMGLQAYCRLHGLVYQLGTQASSYNTIPEVPVNIDFTTSILTDKLVTVNWETVLNKQSWFVKSITDHMRLLYARTATALLPLGKARARQLLNACLQNYPNAHVPLDVYNVQMPALFLQSGDTAQADHVAALLYGNMKEQYDASLSSSLANALWDRRQTEALYAVQELNSYYQMRGNTATAEALGEELVSLKQKYEAEKERRGIE